MAFFVLRLGSFAVLLIFGLGFGARFLISFLNVEYEYIFTNGELDIDIIYDRSRRKRVFTANLKNAEIMAHILDETHARTFDAVRETRDFSTGVISDSTYVFITAQNNKKIKVIIDPNEKMLKAFSGALTRKNLHVKPAVFK
jgi:hypothetical protein